MKIFAVWGAYRQEIQTLDQTAYAVFQKVSLKKEKLLSVCIVDAEDALGSLSLSNFGTWAKLQLNDETVGFFYLQ